MTQRLDLGNVTSVKETIVLHEVMSKPSRGAGSIMFS